MPQVSYQIVSSVSLNSSYTAYTYNDGHHETSTPSTGSASYGFSYAAAGIPAGSTINSAVFRVESFGSPLHGTSIRGVRVNGTDVSTSIPSATDVDIKPYLSTGDNTITLRFKSGTSNTTYPSIPPTSDPNDRTNSSSLAFNDVKVVINYTPPYTAPSVTVVRLNGTTATLYGAASASATLSWEAVSGNYNAISSYSVFRSNNGGAYSLLASGIGSTSTTVTLPGTAGQYSQFYVVAVGEYSSSAAAYSPQTYAYSSPSAPTAVSVSPSSVMPGASVTLSWSGANAGVGVGISSYSIRRSTSPGGTYTEATTSTAASKSFTAPDTAGTYYYKVLAYGSVSGYNSPLSSAYATLAVQNPRSTLTLDKTTVPMDNSTQITATISAADSGYTHTVQWYIDGTYTKTNTKSAGNASDTFKCPLTWNSAFPSASGGTAYCLLTTYSGGVAVGTYSKSFSVSVPDNILPAVSLAVSAADGFGSYYLKGISRATAAATASGAYGSTIASYSVYGGGYSGTSATLNTGILNVVGTNTFTATVIDSRGRSKSTTQNITVTNYSKPVISAVSCYRSDSGKNSLVDGTCITVGATFAITSLTGNAITVKQAQYRQSGASTWSSATALTSGATTVIATGISTAYAYEVLITLTDTVGQTSTYNGSIIVTPKLFDFRNDRAGIGRAATSANRLVLPTNWDIEHKGQTLDARYPQRADPIISNTLKDSRLTTGNQQLMNVGGGNRIYVGNPSTAMTFETSSDIQINRSGIIRYLPTLNTDGSYWGINGPDGNDTNYIRTTNHGILPYAPGYSQIGTLEWPFGNFFTHNLNLMSGFGLNIRPASGEASIRYNNGDTPKWVVGKGTGDGGDNFGWWWNPSSVNRMVLETSGNLKLFNGSFVKDIPAGSQGNVLLGTIGNNDFFRIAAGGGDNGGWMEIATADDGNEPIYVRQYIGTFGSPTRTLTLLDGSGNTVLPGMLEFESRGIPSANFATQFRQDVFGNTGTNGSKIRAIRSETGLSNFFQYSSGLAWSVYDTHGYIDTSYSTADVIVGGGNANNLNWTARLYHTGNFTRGTGTPSGGWDGCKYSQYI